jgi:hypothetical protein
VDPIGTVHASVIDLADPRVLSRPATRRAAVLKRRVMRALNGSGCDAGKQQAWIVSHAGMVTLIR